MPDHELVTALFRTFYFCNGICKESVKSILQIPRRSVLPCTTRAFLTKPLFDLCYTKDFLAANQTQDFVEPTKTAFLKKGHFVQRSPRRYQTTVGIILLFDLYKGLFRGKSNTRFCRTNQDGLSEERSFCSTKSSSLSDDGWNNSSFSEKVS